jgi:Ca2+-binding RTX toxin-like protein
MRGSVSNPRSRRLIVTATVALTSLVWGLSQHAAVAPAGTPADLSFAGGVLTIVGSSDWNDRHVLRCRDGFVRVGSSQVPDDPVRCAQVREVVARPQGGTDNVDMSQVGREFGPGGPIKITINGGPDSDVLAGAPLHHNFLNGGPGSDRVAGGELADRLVGGTGSDLMDGFRGADRMFGGPGNDALYGGGGRDALNGGPGRDREVQ